MYKEKISKMGFRVWMDPSGPFRKASGDRVLKK